MDTQANAGPYKYTYPYWTGVLLLVRTALFLVFAFNYMLMSQAWIWWLSCMIASLFVLMLAWSLGGIYRKKSLDILESSFVLNLGITAAVMQHVKFQQKNQAAVVYTSTGIAFGMFLGILVYHFGCKKLAKLNCTTCLSNCFSRSPVNDRKEDGNLWMMGSNLFWMKTRIDMPHISIKMYHIVYSSYLVCIVFTN